MKVYERRNTRRSGGLCVLLLFESIRSQFESRSTNQAPTPPTSAGTFWKLTNTHDEQSDVIVSVIGEEFFVRLRGKTRLIVFE